MDNVKSPSVKILLRKKNQRVLEQVKEEGYSDIVSILAANRLEPGEKLSKIFKPEIKTLNKELPLMKDLDRAAKRLFKAVINKEIIALCVDFDVDGISSGVVMKKALIEHLGVPEERIRLHVNNRLEFGYGFNPKALDVILKHDEENPPTLLITADQGSNDNAQTRTYNEYMKARGYENADVIITDHHGINEDGGGEDAYAFVNPQQEGCDFPDKTVCGCVVALFLCIRAHLFLKKHYQDNNIDIDVPSMQPLIAFACMATIADCVSLRSEINRFIIRYGKSKIQEGQIPAFAVIKENITTPETIITTKDIAFSLAPRINADSRTGGDGSTAVNFLMSKTIEDARFYWEKLTTRNNNRKDQEKTMLKNAVAQASQQYYELGRRGLTLYLPEGNHGIHGIVASRIKERFNCPTIIFSPVDLSTENANERELSASGRSVDGIRIDSILVQMQKDGLDFAFGGHKMALGVKKVTVAGLSEFAEAFDKGVKAQADATNLPKDFFSPFVMIDHVLDESLLGWLRGMDILKELNYLDPYGQRFESPAFALNIRVKDFRTLGQNKEHVKIIFQDTTGYTFNAMFFNYDNSPIYQTLLVGNEYTIAVELNYDSWGKKLGMQILTMEEGYNNVQTV